MKEERLSKLRNEIIQLHQSVSNLKELFPVKSQGFTLDGRLVGDIGEVLVAELFQIKLYDKVQHYYDAETTYEPHAKVQIKATFKDSLTFNHLPDFFIGIKLDATGAYRVVYNGPGKYIYEEFKHRAGIGKTLLSFPIKRLEEISSRIKEHERIREKMA